MTEVILSGLVGAILGGALVWFWRAAAYAQERNHAEQERKLAERVVEEKERTLQASLREMLAQVTNVTNEALKAREAEFAAQSGREMSATLAPLREQLKAFQSVAEASRKTNGELGVKMETFFTVLQRTAGDFGKQAKSFTDALTGANKKQGVWGELILQQVLADCGLREGEHFVAQQGSGGGIPDFQVFDPGSHRILIIDSKMSWTKYEEAYRLEEGPARTAALREHVQSVKRHVDELARANYPETQTPLRAGYTFVPLTAMFVPCDAALAAAIREEPGLVDYAFKKNVALVTPLTLFGFLQLVSRAWAKYNADRNSEKIFEQAHLLIERLDGLFAHFEKVGDCLAKAQAEHASVMTLLAEGGRSVKGPAYRILKLGGKDERKLKSVTLLAADEEKSAVQP